MAKLSSILVFLNLVGLISSPILVKSQSRSEERSILLSIKQQWGNPPVLSSWNSSTSPCTWPEIKCSSAGAVTGIFLTNYNITGHFPDSICSLNNLTSLVFAWNYFSGQFPTSLYNCSALTYLDVSQNLFHGPIPEDIGRRLSPSSLQYLDLTGNDFSGDVPASIGELKELRTLGMMQNSLNGTYPPEIGNLTNLESLLLAYNPFSDQKLHPEIGKLKKLKYLRMNDCHLVGEIPDTFSGLDSLEHLDLISNNLVGEIPDGLLKLNHLQFLYLYKNRLSGEIPSSVEALNLTEIDLSFNNLTGSIPQDFGKLKNLTILQMFNNHLTGDLPLSIGLLPQLKTVKLFHNSLSGHLPSELGLHSNFQSLEIGYNHFSGPIPQNLCANGAFFGITAFVNNLSGEIPQSLANCKSLKTLQLYNNSFTGEIPSAIWTLPLLYSLQLSFNRFSGQLPDKLSPNMTRLEIDNNQFSGEIPSSGSSTWTNLHVFKGGNNMLSGSVPSGLASLSKLEQLSLEGNRLSGELPALGMISSLKSLTMLNLARNGISGSIPSSLGNLPVLSYLDLSTNALSGEIPPELGNLETLNYLNLSNNNQLTGEVPHSLDNTAYENSYLNTRLCTKRGSDIISTLPRCYSSAGSSSSKHQLGSKYLAVIFILALFVFLVTLYFTFFMIKELRQRRRRGDIMAWKLTSFQRLEFTEDTILCSLSDHNVVGSGGSGKVYRVQISRAGNSFVAVKKIWNNKNLDDSQFLAEIQILGTIRHSNIVKLLCCIYSEESKLLVYEYMENQSLDRWIHTKKRRIKHHHQINVDDQEADNSSDSSNTCRMLDWPSRLRIAIGTAQGLNYMHHDCSPPIIHRDVKSSNILLDSNFNAKLADFGLAKISVNNYKGEPNTMSAVAGSFGYFAPEYRYTRKVNEKVDVYSFGVVLLELVTGKEANSGDDTLNLADWSWKHYSEDRPILEALDQDLMVAQPCNHEEMCTVFKLGLMCTSNIPTSRPSMREVLQILTRCNPSLLQDDDAVKKGAKNIERDFAPLLATENYLSTYKNSGSKKRDVQQDHEEEDHFSMV